MQMEILKTAFYMYEDFFFLHQGYDVLNPTLPLAPN